MKKDKNIENTSVVDEENKESALGKKLRGIVSYFIFFAVVIGLFLSVGEGPRVIGGYGVFNVLTRSMQSTIPQDSLVITQSVDAREIEIGDDITFMAGPTATITHRVIAIDEDLDRTGMRGFTTQGTDNATKDKDVTPENNVVGKVIWHNYHLGVVTVFLQDNWYFIVAYLVMFMLIKKIILKFMGDDAEEEEESTEEPSVNNVPPHANNYDTGLWDVSALYEQPQGYDTAMGMYNQQGTYSVDAYGNPIVQNQGIYGGGYNDVQYDQYGQPISYDYGMTSAHGNGLPVGHYPEYDNQMNNQQSYGTPTDTNQQW